MSCWDLETAWQELPGLGFGQDGSLTGALWGCISGRLSGGIPGLDDRWLPLARMFSQASEKGTASERASDSSQQPPAGDGSRSGRRSGAAAALGGPSRPSAAGGSTHLTAIDVWRDGDLERMPLDQLQQLPGLSFGNTHQSEAGRAGSQTLPDGTGQQLAASAQRGGALPPYSQALAYPTGLGMLPEGAALAMQQFAAAGQLGGRHLPASAPSWLDNIIPGPGRGLGPMQSGGRGFGSGPGGLAAMQGAGRTGLPVFPNSAGYTSQAGGRGEAVGGNGGGPQQGQEGAQGAPYDVLKDIMSKSPPGGGFFFM